MSGLIEIHHADSVGHIVLNRPDKRNALTTAMIRQIGDGVQALAHAEVEVIVVRSSGRHFSAGADITEWAAPSSDDARRMSRAGVDAFGALAEASMPTIAVIDGVAAGGGLELALACDLRIATNRSRLGLPEAGLANLPAYGGIARLVHTVGAVRARELLFTADLVDAERAEQLGLVTQVVEPDQLDEAVGSLVGRIRAADSRTVALAKALTGASPIDGLLAQFTSQSPESRRRKEEFLAMRRRPTEGAPS